MNTQKEYEHLKRKNRRRLLGAVVVVVLCAIILISILSSLDKKTPQTTEVSIETFTMADSNTDMLDDVYVDEEPNIATLPAAVNTDNALAKDLELQGADTSINQQQQAQQQAQAQQQKLAQQQAQEQARQKKLAQQQAEEQAQQKKLAQQQAEEQSQQKKLAQQQAQQSKVNPQDILEGRVVSADVPKANGQVVIQVAAFYDTNQAEALRQKLTATGYNSHIVSASTDKGNILRVRVGPYVTREQAQQALMKLNSAGFDGIIVSR